LVNLSDAQHSAILNEFSTYNKILTGHRHPVQELTRRQANDQRYRNVIAHRTAEAAANSMAPQDPDEANVSPLHGKRGAR
jgi:hypothetical protein